MIADARPTARGSFGEPRTIAASVDRTFRAVGTLEGIRGWWTPLVSGSTRPGRTLTLRFAGLNEKIRFRVEVNEPPHRAVWRCLGHDSLEEWAGTRLHFEVRAKRGEQSVLTMRHEGLVPSLDCYVTCRAGWERFIDSLVSWVETGRGHPYEGASTKPNPPRAQALEREPTSGDAAYASLVRKFAGDPRVTLPTAARGKFGTNALKVDGKIFAMSLRGALAIKLPAAEIDALQSSM